MKIVIDRFTDDKSSTVGLLTIDGVFYGFTMEDAYHEEKIRGKTRIPSGEYKLELRTMGGLTQKYKQRYGAMHKGMLWLRDIENFEYIYIHVGNNEDDTDGCILVGTNCRVTRDDMFVSGSSLKYQEIYPIMANAILDGEEVTVVVTDDKIKGN